MTSLIKDASYIYTPGTPSFPGAPGVPAVPERTVVSTAETPGHWVTGANANAIYANQVNAWKYQALYLSQPPSAVWVPSYSTTTSFTIPAIPAIPPKPPIAATPGTAIKNLNLGWNSGAKSKERVFENQLAVFQFAPSSVGIVAGLVDDPSDDTSIINYREITYGFYASRGVAKIMMAGIEYGDPISYTAADEFAIQYAGRSIIFLKNSKVLKTVTGKVLDIANGSSKFSIFSQLYSAGDTILNTSIVDVAVLSTTTVTTGIRLAAYGGNSSIVGISSGIPITTTVNAPQNVAVVSMRPFRSRNADRPYAESRASLQSIETMILAGSILDVASAFVNFMPLSSGAYGTTGTVGSISVSTLPLRSRNSDHAYAEASVQLAPMITYGQSYLGLTMAAMAMNAPTLHATASRSITTAPAPSGGSVMMPVPTLKMFAGDMLKRSLPSVTMTGTGAVSAIGRAQITAPSLKMLGTGSISTVGRAVMAMPGYSLLANGVVSGVSSANMIGKFGMIAYAGDAAKIKAPAYLLNMAGSVSAMARATLTAPSLQITAGATVSTVGHANMTLTGKLSVSGRTGWRASSLSFSGGYLMSGSAIHDAVGHARLTAPRLALIADAITETVARGDMLLPMLKSSHPASAKLTIPTYAIRFTASGDIALDYEAYALTLSHAIDTPIQSTEVSIDAMTRYTRYPFTQIVRFGDSYYGASADGLYLLEGDTDNGLPIAWGFELTQNDYGQSNLKRVLSSVVGGRIPPLVEFTLKIGERANETYSYNNAHNTTVQNYRQRFGRGVRARYLSVGMNCKDGSDFEIDSISMEVETLSRKTHG